MKWVTREHPKTDRIACPWLIRKFIDPDAEIVYVPRDQVLPYAEREGAISFKRAGCQVHAPRQPVLVRGVDPGLQDPRGSGDLAHGRVVHGADVSEDVDTTPESAGLLAIADGFALLRMEDQRRLELELRCRRRPLRLGPAAGDRPAHVTAAAFVNAPET